MRTPIALLLCLCACQVSWNIGPDAGDSDADVSVAWMRTLYARVEADGLAPPHAARLFAYTSVAAHEAVAPGSLSLRPLAGRLAVPELPSPEPGLHDWPTVASAAMETVASGLFDSADSDAAFLALREQQVADRSAAGVDPAVIERSIAHGERVGRAVVAWADSDGYLDTRGLEFEFPDEVGIWEPTPPAFAPCLEPFWGTLRPFALASGDACKPPPPAEWSDEPGSDFHAEALVVYEASKTLTDEQLQIAKYWADDPGQTGTPPGHWVWIAAGVIEAEALPLDEALEVQTTLTVALADAFVSAWDEKYRSCVMRPITYLDRHVEPGWTSIIGTPPFPEYTSGHSVASGAAAEVLTDRFGAYAFVDDTHAERFGVRQFDSFEEAADQAAISRLYGGIHYPMGIEDGLDQGRCVGQTVVEATR